MPPKHQRLITTAVAVLTLLALAACSSATAAPVSGIQVDPEVDPAGFLAELPADEVACATEAVVSRERLEKVISRQPGYPYGIWAVQLRTAGECFSDNTARRVIIGQLERNIGPLSDQTSVCAAEKMTGWDLTPIFVRTPTDAAAQWEDLLQMLFCLNADERGAYESNAPVVEEVFDIDGIQCIADNSGPTGLEEVAEWFASEAMDAPVRLYPAFIDCGILNDADFAGSGMTAAEMACLLRQLDEETANAYLSKAPRGGAGLSPAQDARIMAAAGICGIIAPSGVATS